MTKRTRFPEHWDHYFGLDQEEEPDLRRYKMLKAKAVEGIACCDFKAMKDGVSRFHACTQVSQDDYGRPNFVWDTDAVFEVPDMPEYLKAFSKGSLIPGDDETRRYLESQWIIAPKPTKTK